MASTGSMYRLEHWGEALALVEPCTVALPLRATGS